ncbi:hypothetical protein Tcan_00498, partial [Toxocara canis]
VTSAQVLGKCGRRGNRDCEYYILRFRWLHLNSPVFSHVVIFVLFLVKCIKCKFSGDTFACFSIFCPSVLNPICSALYRQQYSSAIILVALNLQAAFLYNIVEPCLIFPLTNQNNHILFSLWVS